MTPPTTKISKLRGLMHAEAWRDAVKLAATFPRLGEEKTAILRGWEAYTRPDFQRQIGRDPSVLIEAARDALIKKYGAAT